MINLNFYLSPHMAPAFNFHEPQSSSNALCCYTFRCKHVNITGPWSKVEKRFLPLKKKNGLVTILGEVGVFFVVFFCISRSKYLPSNDGLSHTHTHAHTTCAQFDVPKTNLCAGDVSPKKSLRSTHRENLCSLYLPQKRLIRFEFHQHTHFAVGSVTVANFILLAS